MAESTAPGISPEILEFMNAWSASLSHVMEQVTGSAFPALIVLDAVADEQRSRKTDLHIAGITGGSLHGEMEFSVPRLVASQLAASFRGEQVAAEGDLTSATQEALLELFRQIAGEAASRLKARWHEVQITVQLSAPPTWTAAGVGYLRAGLDQTSKLICELQISSALAAELRANENSRQATDKPAENLERLMDVELEVTLRFGEKRLLLRELLEVFPGAVVELDRRVQEPVDLLLDGKLLARGEVVVVDGNYGLKVTEVLSPQ